MLAIITPKEIIPEAQAALVRHGCIINSHETYSEVLFPEGTTRTEIRPRMPQSERYRLVLPDGYVVQQVYARYLEQSMLYYSRESTPSDEISR